MTSGPKVRVYIACSLDGFIAGPDGDLSWLPDDESLQDQPARDSLAQPLVSQQGEPVEYDQFIGSIGAMLIGRSTYDAVRGFDVPWPYGDLPVLVATTRQLGPHPSTVRAATGDISALVHEARAAAGELDVYLDGGNLIRQALDADLVDDMIITIVPVILGSGHPLFAGARERHHLRFGVPQPYGPGLIQVRAEPSGDTPRTGDEPRISGHEHSTQRPRPDDWC